ncbi:hypothetical protein M8312_09725 [Sphingomonas sp. KRR8]|uniref:hypothetical protein n=1 Tax=Sphingomonas sp. KRR8 TaxID=2942996 RepID=UPI0020221496|nr:hypothetical protein [Sphingomonas sp. KRR8]URD60074.1 hypothetical protein M8312_09725 [Sphingomonas sp. KRR8]
MRVFTTFLAILMIAAPAHASTASFNPYHFARNCPETPMSLARKKAEKPRLRRLDQLPDASAFAAVDRRVGGCPAPLMLPKQKFGR